MPSTKGDDRFSQNEVKVALSKVVEHIGGQERYGQNQMAFAVAKATKEGEHLGIQAGTGIGKTLAYLIPAILSGETVVVATTTKILQDQLINKDLPQIKEALSASLREQRGKSFSYSALKGRDNYLCRLKFENALQSLPPNSGGRDDLNDQPELEQLVRVRVWEEATEVGDRAELEFEPDSKVWRQVSMRGGECPGRKKCEFGTTCYYEVARDKALASDIVVTNHYLYLLASQLEEGAVLPKHTCAIIDEAHDLVNVATNVFSSMVSPVGLERLHFQSRRTTGVLDSREDNRLLNRLDRLAKELTNALGPLGGTNSTDLVSLLSPTSGSTSDNSEPSQLRDILERLRSIVADLHDAIPIPQDALPGMETSKNELKHKYITALENLDAFLGVTDEDAIWVNADRDVSLRRAPKFIGEFLANQVWGFCTVILTSATLSERDLENLGMHVTYCDV